ncbi:MAG: hypothetical protein J6Z35_11825, partial [Lachnospiraceae bacterium]|nr:hypothetical protein [Lachnospiraceae bacterium]
MKNIRVYSEGKKYGKLSGRAAACILAVSLFLQAFPVQVLAAGDGKGEKTEWENQASAEDVESPVLEKEPFYIHNVQELLQLAENCRVSDYSAGRAVYLMQDLDLGEIEEFEGIASFSGTFFGNRCTVSGVHLEKGSESIGFFRYLEEGAVVRDLTVCCETQNDDGGKILGGIAGVNGGTIKNCSFSGKLTGAGVTGGIAGLNGSGAGILQCSAAGEVSGIHMVG